MSLVLYMVVRKNGKEVWVIKITFISSIRISLWKIFYSILNCPGRWLPQPVQAMFSHSHPPHQDPLFLLLFLHVVIQPAASSGASEVGTSSWILLREKISIIIHVFIINVTITTLTHYHFNNLELCNLNYLNSNYCFYVKKTATKYMYTKHRNMKKWMHNRCLPIPPL